MKPMPPRRLRTLIIGFAMFIIGPATGLCCYFGVAMHAIGSFSGATTLAQLQQAPGQLLLALIPAGLGMLCGATGFFIVISTLAIHFLGGEPGAPRHA